MEQNALRGDAKLAARVMRLMTELQRRNDPRFQEVLEVLETARKSHPSYNPRNPTASAEAFKHGHRAVADYVERKHPDLYGIIQTASPDL